MKNLIQYRYTCENAMFNYLKDKDVQQLISELKRCESLHRQEIECTNDELGMWFKFGKDNTLVNTIDDIEAMLNLPSNHPNYMYITDLFQLVINLDTDSELQIYFS